MLYKIFGNGSQAFRVAQNRKHIGRFLFALFYLVFICPNFGGFGVILFNLFQFVVVQNNFRGSAFIHDAYRDFIFHRFGHRVSIDDFSKHIKRRIYGRAGETDERGIG